MKLNSFQRFRATLLGLSIFLSTLLTAHAADDISIETLIDSLQAAEAQFDSREEFVDWMNEQVEAARAEMAEIDAEAEAIQEQLDAKNAEREKIAVRIKAIELGVKSLDTLKPILEEITGKKPEESIDPAQENEAKTSAWTVEELMLYDLKIKPILADNCNKCHGAGERIKAEFDLTSREGILRGGDQGPAVNLEEPEKSLLLAMVSYKDEHHEMPPAGKLDQSDIDALAQWVDMGLPWPGTERTDLTEAEAQSPEERVKEIAKTHWAYQPVSRPEPPKVGEAAWAENPIDAFVYARLDDAGLKPNGPSPRAQLIRRATYDLTGLPPTPGEVRDFVNDPDPDAYAKLVDRLLESPHYGEKWGRHWLDVVRYAETNGYERDNPKPHIWRYRDYVINAFNTDKPYDRFILEQLAGDELPDSGPEAIVATGYYRLGIWDDEPADPEQARFDDLDDIVGTTASAFLGSTLACARCHDHKIDPFTQSDYYSTLSFFRNITPMHTTDAVRSILKADEQAAYEKALREKQQEIDEVVVDMIELERTFQLLYEQKNESGDGAPTSDMVDLSYRFYRDTWDKLPDFQNTKFEDEGPIPHNFFTLSPATRKDSIGLVFEGRLNVPETGEYTFNLHSDDGVRLIIGGKTVAEQDGLGSFELSGKTELQAGFTPIRLEYFNKGGELKLDVRWSGPGVEDRPLSLAGKTGGMADYPKLIKEQGEEILGKLRTKKYRRLEAKKRMIERRKVEGKFASAIEEFDRSAPETFVLIRGNAHVPGDKVEPRFPFAFGGERAEIEELPEEVRSTGRRLTFAKWIADPDNPMTARVMVNRIWQHHFSRGIVRSPNDFGFQGISPTHPLLLDWLASEFVANDWSIKSLHRQIMNSKTYKMSSEGNEKALAEDPENNLFWRYDMRRLSAEELRDSILAMSGRLNLDIGGPSVYPKLPQAVLQTSSKPDQVWKVSEGKDQFRRSVYIHLKRSLLEPLLSDFDLADTDSSCPVRFVTTQPTQALNLLNSDFANEEAIEFARRLKQTTSDTREQVKTAISLVTAREAKPEEIELGLQFIAELKDEDDLDDDTALSRFALLALNLNEFVFLD